VWVNGGGDLYVADTNHCCVRGMKNETKFVMTFAGDGSCEYGNHEVAPASISTVACDCPYDV
jgi:hypothetical protein